MNQNRINLFLIFILKMVILNEYTISSCLCANENSLPIEGEVLWDQRNDKEKLNSCISYYKNYIKKDNSNEEACIRLSWAYYYMGSYFLEKKDDKKISFQKGMIVAEKAVEINPDSAGGNFWLAVNKGSRGQFQSRIRSSFMFPDIVKHMGIVKKQDENYNYGGYFRFWGRVLYDTPSFLISTLGKTVPDKFINSGNITKKDQVGFILKAIEYEPNYFMNYVFLAESYFQLNQRDLAIKSLKYVIDTPSDFLKEAKHENEIWKQHARKLYKKHYDEK